MNIMGKISHLGCTDTENSASLHKTEWGNQKITSLSLSL